jgi:hypothetical protein
VKLVDNPMGEGADTSHGDTIGVDSILICRKDLSEEIVYQLTKQFLAMLSSLAKSAPQAAGFDPDKASATPIPLHAGAARYYREQQMLKCPAVPERRGSWRGSDPRARGSGIRTNLAGAW